MKVIDLLNKIANGEEVPEKVKYNNKIYEYTYEIEWYLREDLKNELFIDKKHLNDEVEIIEDTPNYIFKHYSYKDKKIEKLYAISNTGDYLIEFPDNEQLMSKINEIIDRLNGEDNGQSKNND